MAVAVVETDTWLQHLLFTGGPRPTPFGPVDGVFYGLMAGTGAAGGGNFSLSGRLSFDRKEDWVYIVGGTHTRQGSEAASGDVFEQVNTGPLIPTQVSGINNPTFEWGGVVQNITANNLTITPVSGQTKVTGMPIFGDKHLAGVFLMYAAGWETNIDGATYSAQIWGWIIKYQSFFRNRPPSAG